MISLMNDPGANVKGLPKILDKALIYIVSCFYDGVIYKGRMPRVSGRARCVHLPNAVSRDFFDSLDPAEAREALGLDPGRRYVLFVSANDVNRPVKRKDLFDSVLAKLERVGYSPLYMANVERERVKMYFSAADALLLTSDVEGSPNAVKEALATGTPVVARRLPGVETLLGDCPGCSMFEHDDVDSIAVQVSKCASRTKRIEIRDHMRHLGLSPENVSGRLVRLYEAVLSGG